MTYPCPLCESAPCLEGCRANEWPRILSPREVLTRVLIGLGMFLAFSAMVCIHWNVNVALGLALGGLLTLLVLALLKVAEMPEEQGRLMSIETRQERRGRR